MIFAKAFDMLFTKWICPNSEGLREGFAMLSNGCSVASEKADKPGRREPSRLLSRLRAEKGGGGGGGCSVQQTERKIKKERAVL